MDRIFRANNNGKLKFIDEKSVETFLRTMPETVDVVIKKHRDSRSIQQNRYYWRVIIGTLSGGLGYFPEEMHEILKSLFLKDWIKFKGEEICIVRSTTSLNTKEFEEYQSKIRTWASVDHQIYIPLPNEVAF